MELKELTEKTLDLLEIEKTDEMSKRLFEVVINNDTHVYERFCTMVENDLSADWLQKIFQYYNADRKEKMQDYTPKSLAKFIGQLIGESNTVIDMCAGSGALTIQKWNMTPEQKFELYEFDENVIPFLLFNMAVRNIKCTVYHADVLQDEVFHVYTVSKGDKYGEVKEVEQ
ncbi:N-6 DNA methylase [Roseburia sp.]|uniref:N-6 DNA methylase n=1 Tax=Roseburia sp. TaxID=2049040 RepID=UPI00351FF4D9